MRRVRAATPEPPGSHGQELSGEDVVPGRPCGRHPRQVDALGLYVLARVARDPPAELGQLTHHRQQATTGVLGIARLVHDVLSVGQLLADHRVQVPAGDHVVQVPEFHHAAFQLGGEAGTDPPTRRPMNRHRGLGEQPLVSDPQLSGPLI
jgi:hypothetical protein